MNPLNRDFRQSEIIYQNSSMALPITLLSCNLMLSDWATCILPQKTNANRLEIQVCLYYLNLLIVSMTTVSMPRESTCLVSSVGGMVAPLTGWYWVRILVGMTSSSYHLILVCVNYDLKMLPYPQTVGFMRG